ncbi:hypothetical protein [Arcobacter sp. LA11]|uniref:hypothetical protein n=1 Tax=Arcobacter sp. LA11 TaxID=1898176 RepID=UPI000933BEA3|nr:hypothetical protein [Arcobacter sp. LA11]
MKNTDYKQILLILLLTTSACSIDLKTKKLYNKTAYISSQCYTKTENELNKNILHNPCYSCHTKNKIPNFTMQDEDLQEAYDFPEIALKNPWINLFKDRTKEVSKIDDIAILNYIRENNYKDSNNKIILESKLKNLSKEWDFNNNGKWDGYIPDVHFNFDEEGFDKNSKGEYTGWRAFAYYPFLGTFWPTNGSTDDVLIRLSKVYQNNEKGEFDKEIYKINLSIIESLIKQKDINIEKVNEKDFGVDLNQNGKIDISSKIVFNWKKPTLDMKTMKQKNFSMSYVGEAKKLQIDNIEKIAPGLYPVGTEFIHSVRYIDIDENKNIKMSSRMKELRYGKKTNWNTYSQLSNLGFAELKEKRDFPDRTDIYVGNMETGLSNKRGWYYQGFIEDINGNLRPQNYEETVFCMGCHSNIGAITDSTFVFKRKFEKNNLAYGWYHWTQKGIRNIADKKLLNDETEYVKYLKENSAGDEFRMNKEIVDKFFIKNWETNKKNIEKDLISKLENPNKIIEQKWKFKEKELDKIRKDISYLILPTSKRALELNKAYKIIVEEQSFIYGRDPHIKPTNNVHKIIKPGQMTHLQKIVEK